MVAKFLSEAPDLLPAAREGRLVLFLGAGASKSSITTSGDQMPDGEGLRDLIVRNFLKPQHAQYDLKTVYDLACSRTCVRDVQRYMRTILEPFQPTQAHLKVPKLPWQAIVTTNYDLLVERSYEALNDASLAPVTKDGDVPLDQISSDKTLYLKLHGCISEADQVDAPLVTSTEQIIDHKKGRSNMFKTFLELGQNYHLAIVGYGMADDNLRSLFYRLINEGDSRPRHYIIRPGWDDVMATYWRDRRFEPVDADFDSFVGELLASAPSGSMALGKLAKAQRSTSLTKFISRAGARETEHLVAALGAVFEHVTGDITDTGEPKQFYSGVNQGWFPIQQSLDVQRVATTHVLKRWILPPAVEKAPKLFLLKGHAGSGKTITLRRAAWEAATKYEKLVLYMRSGADIDVEALEEIISLTSQTVYLFVDDAGEHASSLKFIADKGAVRGWPLVIVGAERVNEWNQAEDEVGIFANAEFLVEYLLTSEIEDLVILLESHNSLGELASLNIEERVERFKGFAGRQLLVALHEATKGASFEDILEDEYDGIYPADAKALYLDICALHRLGPPVRAGLISRVHGISFDEFESRLYKPLENIVVVGKRNYRGDLTYQARHNYIAEIVFNKAASTPSQKQELLLRIIDKLNPSYTYDEGVLYQLIKARSVADMLPDRAQGLSIYEAAERNVGRTVGVLHQRALYELRLAGDPGGLSRAESLLREGLEAEPHSTMLKHSLAEVALKHSELARSDIEAAAYRQEAAKIARSLISTSRRSYAHHTLAKVAIAALDQVMRDEATRTTTLATQAVNSAIQEAETVIRSGLNHFPNDPYLLTAEAQLADRLKNADRARKALEAAFAQNPKAELVANRLSLLLSAKGDPSGALSVLKKSLESNPGSKLLNYRYARTLMDAEPGIELAQPEAMLFYLKRGIQHGQAHLESQYWYGRQLYLSGREAEAKQVFASIDRHALPHRIKNSLSGHVNDSAGSRMEFVGAISTLSETFGLISQSTPSMTVYFKREGGLLERVALSVGMKVRYQLAFNARGPVAVELRPATEG